MFIVTVEFVTHGENFESFLARMRQQALDSLALESGCQQFDVCVDPERENYVFLYEVYRDRAAFDAHLESAHFLDFDATVRDWIIDKKIKILLRA